LSSADSPEPAATADTEITAADAADVAATTNEPAFAARAAVDDAPIEEADFLSLYSPLLTAAALTGESAVALCLADAIGASAGSGPFLCKGIKRKDEHAASGKRMRRAARNATCLCEKRVFE
jgi:hypothetical protein